MWDASSGQHSRKSDCRLPKCFPTRIHTSHALLRADWLALWYPASWALRG